ncbi:hypothetical protein DLM_3091 [Aquitalea magnusonii]|uniref:Uncharacterized protein n=1 Tax=Aquitalea magnusonii TaxID=332411 RepID=A0A3G9GFP5_9NEIS|nr:hypothetical protein DLM_3091 [Aquitalea magnusonii]
MVRHFNTANSNGPQFFPVAQVLHGCALPDHRLCIVHKN